VIRHLVMARLRKIKARVGGRVDNELVLNGTASGDKDVTLSQAELARVSDELENVYKALLADIRNERDLSGNREVVELLDQKSSGSGGSSVAEALADLNVELIDRHVQGIRDVESARQRLVEKSFGTCVDCGADIAFERLLAYPTARRCLSCQEKHEKMYAHKARPRL
jgi:RNA polymerase-binding transcription factor